MVLPSEDGYFTHSIGGRTGNIQAQGGWAFLLKGFGQTAKGWRFPALRNMRFVVDFALLTKL